MQRYRVSGGSRVLEHAIGSTFEHDFDPIHEQRLIVGGAITRLPDRTRPIPTVGKVSAVPGGAESTVTTPPVLPADAKEE